MHITYTHIHIRAYAKWCISGESYRSSPAGTFAWMRTRGLRKSALRNCSRSDCYVCLTESPALVFDFLSRRITQRRSADSAIGIDSICLQSIKLKGYLNLIFVISQDGLGLVHNVQRFWNLYWMLLRLGLRLNRKFLRLKKVLTCQSIKN